MRIYPVSYGIGFGKAIPVSCPQPTTASNKGCCLSANLSSSGKAHCCGPKKDTVVISHKHGKYSLRCPAKTSGCSGDSDCGSGMVCSNGKCIADPGGSDGSGGGGSGGGSGGSSGGGSGSATDTGSTDIGSSLMDFLTTGYTPWIIGGIVVLAIMSKSKSSSGGAPVMLAR